MKKFKDFILSLIIPHRMVRFKDMSVFISLFLLLLGCVVSVFSSNIRMVKYVESSIVHSDYSKIIDEEVKIDGVSIKVDNEGKASFTYPEASNGVFTKTLKDETTTYEVTVVFGDIAENKEENEDDIYHNVYLNNFDIDDYVFYHQNNRKENTVYLLYVFADYSVFHLYDLGQVKAEDGYVSNFTSFTLKTQSVDPNAGIFKNLLGTGYVVTENYYLPKDWSELQGSAYVDQKDSKYYNYATTAWSEKVKVGDTKEIENPETGEKVTVQAMPKHGRVINGEDYLGINFILTMAMTYDDLLAFGRIEDFKLDSFSTNLKTFVKGFFDSRVYLQTDSNKGFLLLIAVFLFILIPVVFAVFVWLFTRRRGMPNFKSYLNIISIIQFYLAILFFIIGWFVNILEVSLIIVLGLLMMLWYYIFVIYQITNRIEKENDEYKEIQIKKETEAKKPEKPEFKKIDDDVSIIG